jgi:predicted transcriptional regulator YdeE
MEFQTITLEPFYLVGISVRTTNEGGQSGKDIGQLWERFFKENILAQIRDKTSNDIYCVYTDYQRDASGPYTTLLGCAVSIQQTVPMALQAKSFRVQRTACIHPLVNYQTACWQRGCTSGKRL